MRSTLFISICIALIVGVSCKSKKTIEPSQPYTTEVESVYDLIHLASDASNEKDYQKANFYYEKYIEQTEDSFALSDVYHNYAISLFYLAETTKDKKYLNEALQKIEKAAELDSTSSLCYLNWGIMLSSAARKNKDNKKTFAQCFQKLEKAAKLNPDEEDIQQEWANNLLYIGIPKDDRASITQSIDKYEKITRRDANFYNNYGLALLYRADIDDDIPQHKYEIEKILLKADQLGTHEASETLACLYAKTGGTDEALKWLKKYLDNDGKLSRKEIKKDFKDIREDKRFKDLLKNYDYRK